MKDVGWVMSKLEFKPEDFNAHNIINVRSGEITISREDASDCANARLAEMLAESPVVYAKIYDNGDMGIWSLKEDCDGDETASARLVNIEEVKHGRV